MSGLPYRFSDMPLTKLYLLDLQGCMLDLGYENVELNYLAKDEKSATLFCYYRGTTRSLSVGLYEDVSDTPSSAVVLINGIWLDRLKGLPDPKSLAKSLWEKDPCVKKEIFAMKVKTDA